MPLIHFKTTESTPTNHFLEVFIETGTVCRSFLRTKRILLANEDLEYFQLNKNDRCQIIPFDENYSPVDLHQVMRNRNDEAKDLVLVFTKEAFRNFKKWVRSEVPDWVDRCSYLLISNSCEIQLSTADVSNLKQSSKLILSRNQSRNIQQIRGMTTFYWSTLTKGTKLGFFWLAFRAVASPIPILFVAMSSISGSSSFASLERMLLSLSLFSLVEGGIKHGVRSWRRLGKLNYSKGGIAHILFLGLVGLIDAFAFLAASAIITIFGSGTKEMFKLISIWIVSVPPAVLIGGCLGITIEAIAKKFWDVKFVASYFSLAVLITTPVLIIPAQGWQRTVQTYNPFSSPYYLVGHYFDGPSANLEFLIFGYLALFGGFVFALLKKAKDDVKV